MSQAVLFTKHLAIGYEGKEIAGSINLELFEGEVVSLIGANGIGKSTLLRTLCRLQQPISGLIQINGAPISGYKSTELSKNISVVLTDKLPPSNLTVYELIATGRQPYTNWVGSLSKRDKEVLTQSIDITNTASLLSKKLYQLSDGQLQTVLIARAVAQDTKIIILDEPSTHLDVQNKSALFALLKKLGKKNKTILFSTHDIEWALQASDSVIMMTKNETLQATPAAFRENNYLSKLFDNPAISFESDKIKFEL